MINKEKKIWIDLENSPHVPFFKPIIEAFEKRDYPVLITARDCFQVCSLADRYHFFYKRIGRHYGKKKILKVLGILIRAIQTLPLIIREKPVLAISLGSRTQVLVSKILHIPVIQMTDYEHSNHFLSFLKFLRSDLLIVPEMIPAGLHWRDLSRVSTFPGIKEDVYVPSFNPEPGILEWLGINEEEIVVTIRPPATEAHYHNTRSDDLFHSTIDWLAGIEKLRMVILPRNQHQHDFIRKTWPILVRERKIVIPDKVVEGLNMIWYSDLVISGGGTMNREAAALGVPVYSIFRGEIGAVDKYLSDKGRLTLLENPEDLKTKVILKKWNRPACPDRTKRPALDVIVGKMLEMLEISRNEPSVRTRASKEGEML